MLVARASGSVKSIAVAVGMGLSVSFPLFLSRNNLSCPVLWYPVLSSHCVGD
jgi:hypothetical protein